MKKSVFYSFHYDNDVMRVQQIRNIGVIEGNTPVSVNDWEEVKRGGDAAVKRWIDSTMQNKECVIVLIGSETAERKWVNYEIRKAWDSGKPMFGIYIHNLKDLRTGVCEQGKNPFENIFLESGARLSSQIRCYNPAYTDAYNDIAENLETWVETAINERRLPSWL